MAKNPDDHPCIPFLKSLYQNCESGFINLRFLPSKKSKFISISEIDSIPAILKKHEAENCYFGVATRVEGDGTKEGILQIPALWVDLDTYKLTDPEKEESRQRYKDFRLKPTYIIDSGGGRYFLWQLKEPATKGDIPMAEEYLKRLAIHFHGDVVATDASRILRVPGSINHKWRHCPQVKILEVPHE
jgi:hypothetical protein